MIAPGIPFEDIGEPHLQELVRSGARERRRLEFKQELPARDDAAKSEFRADVSSFANAGGGDLVYGVQDEDGVAVKITPLDGDADAEIRRLESMLRDGLEPRLIGVHTRPIEIGGGWALVMRVPASWTGPHAVKSSKAGTYRFYSRNSAGKYPLDVGEIRSAFLATDSVTQRVREWQTERLGRIIAGETPIRLRETPTVVLHLVPLAAQMVEPAALEGTGIFKPIRLDADGTRWNIDGLLSYALDKDGHGLGYTQLFRDGHLEGTNAADIDWLLQPHRKGTIDGLGLERLIIDGVADSLRALQIAGGEPPFAVLITLLGVGGLEIAPSGAIPRPVTVPIDRAMLLLPDVLCDAFDWSRGSALRPAIDALWQASGWPRSPNYGPTGEWNPH